MRYLQCQAGFVNTILNQEISFRDLYIEIADRGFDVYPNTYYCFREENKQTACFVMKTNNYEVLNEQHSKVGIVPRNLEQKYLAHTLRDPEVISTVVYGPAGTGKTLLVVAAAMDLLLTKQYKSIVFLKSRTQVLDGEEPMGEVPGGVVEKLGPQLVSYEKALQKALGSKSYASLQDYISKGLIQAYALEHLRGVDFSDSFVICDEVQNLGLHTLETLNTRIGNKSKIVMLGDTDQVDFKRDSSRLPIQQLTSNPKFLNSSMTSVIELRDVMRSPYVGLITSIFKDLK